MHRSEREELAKAIRLNMRVAKAGVDQRQKELLADVERQLSEIYKVDDKLWADVTGVAKGAVLRADEEIIRICREHGIPEEFRPGLSLGWFGRGENACAARRAELRRRFQAEIEAKAAAAKTAIEARAAEALTALIAGGLESGQAKEFLRTMPTPEQLLPPIVVPTLPGQRADQPRIAAVEHEDFET
jgi:hypothetical protein